MFIDLYTKGQFHRRYTLKDYGVDNHETTLTWEEFARYREQLRCMIVRDFYENGLADATRALPELRMYLVIESRMNRDRTIGQQMEVL